MTRFEHRPPSAEQYQALKSFEKAFQAIEMMLEEALPAGRYKSLVFTYLEIAAMMASKAVMHPEA